MDSASAEPEITKENFATSEKQEKKNGLETKTESTIDSSSSAASGTLKPNLSSGPAVDLETKAHLRKALERRKGMSPLDLHKAYYNLVGKSLNVRDYGFPTLTAFLLAIPDVVELRQDPAPWCLLVESEEGHPVSTRRGNHNNHNNRGRHRGRRFHKDDNHHDILMDVLDPQNEPKPSSQDHKQQHSNHNRRDRDGWGHNRSLSERSDEPTTPPTALLVDLGDHVDQSRDLSGQVTEPKPLEDVPKVPRGRGRGRGILSKVLGEPVTPGLPADLMKMDPFEEKQKVEVTNENRPTSADGKEVPSNTSQRENSQLETNEQSEPAPSRGRRPFRTRGGGGGHRNQHRDHFGHEADHPEKKHLSHDESEGREKEKEKGKLPDVGVGSKSDPRGNFEENSSGDAENSRGRFRGRGYGRGRTFRRGQKAHLPGDHRDEEAQRPDLRKHHYSIGGEDADGFQGFDETKNFEDQKNANGRDWGERRPQRGRPFRFRGGGGRRGKPNHGQWPETEEKSGQNHSDGTGDSVDATGGEENLAKKPDHRPKSDHPGERRKKHHNPEENSRTPEPFLTNLVMLTINVKTDAIDTTSSRGVTAHEMKPVELQPPKND